MFSREQADSPRNIARVPTGAAGDREIDFPIGAGASAYERGRAVLARADLSRHLKTRARGGVALHGARW